MYISPQSVRRYRHESRIQLSQYRDDLISTRNEAVTRRCFQTHSVRLQFSSPENPFTGFREPVKPTLRKPRKSESCSDHINGLPRVISAPALNYRSEMRMLADSHYRHIQRTFRASQSPEKGLDIGPFGRADGPTDGPREYPARAPRKLHSRVGLPTNLVPRLLSVNLLPFVAPCSLSSPPSFSLFLFLRDKERIEKGC